jgi:hypothetical protein
MAPLRYFPFQSSQSFLPLSISKSPIAPKRDYYCKRPILCLASSKLLTPHPPLRPASVYPAFVGGGGQTRRAERGGGSIFWCGVAQNGAAWHSYGAAWHSMVRRGTVMVRCGTVMVRRGTVWCGVAQSWCGVAQYGAAWHSMVRRGTVGSASACCKAGPSSILGSAPQGGFSH